jgi:hypothetical protein
MTRLTLAVVSLLALAATVAVPGAAAMTPAKTCQTSSTKVKGGKVYGSLTASNVAPSQGRFATCKQARKVMQRATQLGVEEPRAVKGFYCRPTVSSHNNNLVRYVCTFKGADTATFIKLVFTVTYKS